MALAENFFNGLGIVTGVTAGVIAGTLVNISINYLALKKIYKQRLRNFKFELDFNIKRIDDVLVELSKCRNAVNGDALDKYFGYFQLSRVIYQTANTMYADGSLYKCLSHDEIADLQRFCARFSPDFEKYVNDQFQQHQKNISDGTYEKSKAVGDLDFWEKTFNEDKTALKNILKKL